VTECQFGFLSLLSIVFRNPKHSGAVVKMSAEQSGVRLAKNIVVDNLGRKPEDGLSTEKLIERLLCKPFPESVEADVWVSPAPRITDILSGIASSSGTSGSCRVTVNVVLFALCVRNS
jgi:hypothetical protein